MPQIAIEGASALIGTDLRLVERAVVVIDEGRIAAVGQEGDVGLSPGTQQVDASGATLVPGFIDTHVHIGFFDPAEVSRGGVTTVRDLGWPPEKIHPLARRSREPGFRGPRVLAAGPILTAQGGYPARAAWAPAGTAREVDGPAAAHEAVARTLEEGACVIKIALNPPVGPTFAPETLTALVESAHERGARVTGHIYGLGELHKALDSGVDELAHMLMSDERIPDETIERMVSGGMTVVPTLSCREPGSDRDNAVDNLDRFRAAGGRIVYGTDLGNEGPRPGIDPLEVKAMEDAGFDVLGIVRSATVDAASWLGLTDVGCIEVGRCADIVVLEGTPATAEDLTRVRSVWRNGVKVAG